jgi:hypothetical protein
VAVAVKSSLHAGGAAVLQLHAAGWETAMLAACAGNPREVARGSDMHDLHLVMEYVVARPEPPRRHRLARRRPLPRARTTRSRSLNDAHALRRSPLVSAALISIVNLPAGPDDVSLMPLGLGGLSPAGFDVLQGLLEYNNPKDRLRNEP